jgi:hypothetical protein
MVFSMRSVPRSYKKGKLSSISELSWGNELVVEQSPASKNVTTVVEDIVGVRHQTTTVEDAADWEDLVYAVLNCRLCELARAL